MRIEEMIQLMEGARDECRANLSLESVALCYDLMIGYYRKILEAAAGEKGGCVAAVGAYVPVELLYALGIVPFHLEMHALNVTFLSGCQELLTAASEYGIPPEVCSGQRAAAGLALQGLIPRPRIVINTALVCDPAIKTFEVVGKRFGCPTFFLDQPYRFDGAGLRYYGQEIEKLIAFLETETGRRMDRKRLEQTVALSQQAAALYREVGELRKAIPSPVRNIDSFNHCMIYLMLAGTPEAVDYFRVVRDEAREILEGKRPPLRARENYRLLCLYGIPGFAMDLLDWMEQEHGATLVMDTFNAWVYEGEMDPGKPLESLARKMGYWPMAIPFCGPVENWKEMALRMGREYRADGALLLAPIGCQQSCGTIRTVRDALKEELGIPSLLADCDILDPSVVSPEELKGRLEGFFEMLAEAR